MKLFENFFNKKTSTEKPEETLETEATSSNQETVREKTGDGVVVKPTKTIDEIKEAKNKIIDLKDDEYELIKKRQEVIGELKNLGVSENQPNSNKRSDTFNELLNPIEDEIKNIAEELSTIREKFDIPQSRKEVVKERLFRLEKLQDINSEEFLASEAGKILKKEIINLPEESRPKNPIEILSWIKSFQFQNPENPVSDFIEYKKFAEINLRIQKLIENCDEELIALK